MKCLNAAAGHNRDDAILPLFLQTGIRLAELAGLILSDLHEQVPVPSDAILRKCSWSLTLFFVLPQHLNTLFPTILSFAPCNMTSY